MMYLSANRAQICYEVIAITHHLKSPYSANPDFECTRHALYIIKLNALPPASPGRFTPEQQQLLCHTNSVTVGGRIATDVGAKTGKRDRADNSLVRFGGTVAPSVCAVESTANIVSLSISGLNRQESHTQQSASR